MISIKQATVEDIQLLIEIAVPALLQSHGHSAPAADMNAYVASKLNEEVFREEIGDPKNIFHILYYNGQPAGYSKIIYNESHEAVEDKQITKLERLYFLEQFHGKGLGNVLFDFITDLSKAQDQKGIWLQVWTENHRAAAFYKKSGFVVKAETFFKVSETHSNPNHLMYYKFDN